MITKFVRFIVPLILALTFISIPSQKASAQYPSISLDHVDGRLGASDTVFCDQAITFHLRITNATTYEYYGIADPFQVFSPDGANWTPIVFDTAEIGWQNMFDGGVFWGEYSVNGSGSDTITFLAFAIFSGGLPAGFDSVAWTIETYINCSQEGKTICVDSVTNARGINEWLWSGVITKPLWDGPHCFAISGCCTGVRGNVNGQGGDNPNILDLSWIVSYIFRSNNDPGPCPEESDINGDGGIANVLDLTFLVDYIFRGGPLPGPCP